MVFGEPAGNSVPRISGVPHCKGDARRVAGWMQ